MAKLLDITQEISVPYRYRICKKLLYFVFHIFLVEAKKMTLDEREFYKKYQPKKDCILTYLNSVR